MATDSLPHSESLYLYHTEVGALSWEWILSEYIDPNTRHSHAFARPTNRDD